jgi:hypothetical protein
VNNQWIYDNLTKKEGKSFSDLPSIVNFASVVFVIPEFVYTIPSGHHRDNLDFVELTRCPEPSSR